MWNQQSRGFLMVQKACLNYNAVDENASLSSGNQELFPESSYTSRSCPTITDETVSCSSKNDVVEIIAMDISEKETPDNVMDIENMPVVFDSNIDHIISDVVVLATPSASNACLSLSTTKVDNIVDVLTENVEEEQDTAHSHDDPDYSPIENRASEENQKGKTFKYSRQKRKFCKNKGEMYQTEKGIIKRKRMLLPLKECRNQCSKKLSEENRISIFEDYWKLGDHDKRVAYVASCIDVKNKSITRTKLEGQKHKTRQYTYTYTLIVNQSRVSVCKECFLRTLDETPKFIECLMKNKLQTTSGVTKSDQRGRHIPTNKTSVNDLEIIKNHIMSFPAYESHYSRRHTQQKYLGSNLNLSLMYQLYAETVSNPKSYQIYSQEFKKLNLKFKKPALDTCTTCDTLHATIRNADDYDQKAKAEESLRVHQEEADRAYDTKKVDIERSRQNKVLKVLQQVLPVPHLTSGNVFYKRQLSMYNLTIHDCQTGNSTHCMWHEAEGNRGANEIASCLYKYILDHIDQKIEHLICYSDTCGGQNKNSIVIAMFTYLLQIKKSIKTIEHKFLIPGHTHMECDADHSVIEKKSKRSPFPLHHPRDWCQLVRLCGKKNKFNVISMDHKDFFNFQLLLSKKGVLQKKRLDNNGNNFDFRKIKWLKFESNFGIVLYKNSLREEDPFLQMNFNKKQHTEVKLTVLEKSYNGPLPISFKKKENLLSLLPQIDKDAHSFYENLTTKGDERDTDPDLDRLEDC